MKKTFHSVIQASFPLYLPHMKSQILSVAALTGALAVTLLATLPASRGQTTAASDEALLSTLIAEVAAQQVQIAENQTKIDEKLAQIGEEVRQARLFVARGGGAARR